MTNQFKLLISLLFLVVREFSIQDLLTSASTTLILLRHFAWLPWRDHVAQVQSRKAEFEALNGEVIVVSFGNVVSRSSVVGILCIVYSLINTPPLVFEFSPAVLNFVAKALNSWDYTYNGGSLPTFCLILQILGYALPKLFCCNPTNPTKFSKNLSAKFFAKTLRKGGGAWRCGIVVCPCIMGWCLTQG